MKASVKLLFFVTMVVLISAVGAALIHPWLPYTFGKIFRRLATITAALGLIRYSRYIVPQPLQRWGLVPMAGALRQTATGFLIGTVIFGSLLAVLILCKSYHRVDAVAWVSAGAVVLAFLPAALIIGVLEEIFFRGLLLTALAEDWGTVPAVLLSSAIYSVVHFGKQLDQWSRIWPDAVGLLMLGVVFAVAWLRSGRLYVPIGMHAAVAYWHRIHGQFVHHVPVEPAWAFGHGMLSGAVGWSWLALVCVVLLQVRFKS